MRKRTLLAALCLGLASCGQSKTGQPPQVRYGQDACARCGMIISEEAFAAGYVDQAGASVVFDDLGELFSATAANGTLAPSLYVHDLESKEWIAASHASFVRVPAMPTPMGSGLAAFGSSARARTFAQQRGAAVMNWEEALASFRR